MLRISGFTKYEGEIKTLTFDRNPAYHGLGYYIDADGVKWDVNAIIPDGNGRQYVCARPVDSSPYYSTDIGSHCFGSHKWNPYYYEVIKSDPKK